MTMITPSYLGETIEYSSLHACRSTLEDPTNDAMPIHPRDSEAQRNPGFFFVGFPQCLCAVQSFRVEAAC